VSGQRATTGIDHTIALSDDFFACQTMTIC
jgi:hypothetical protein